MDGLQEFVANTNEARSSLEKVRPGIVERAQAAIKQKQQAQANELTNRLATIEAARKAIAHAKHNQPKAQRRRFANDREI